MNEGVEKVNLDTSFIQDENSNSDPVIEQNNDNFISTKIQTNEPVANLNNLFNQAATNQLGVKRDQPTNPSVFAGFNAENSKEDNPFVASANKNQGGPPANLESIMGSNQNTNLFSFAPDKTQETPAAINPFLPNTANKAGLFGNTSGGGLFSSLATGNQSVGNFNQSPAQTQQPAAGGLFSSLGAGVGNQTTTGLFANASANSGLFGNNK